MRTRKKSDDDKLKRALCNHLMDRAPEGWKPPGLNSLPLQTWVSMVYDGLAYGNWPWIDFPQQGTS